MVFEELKILLDEIKITMSVIYSRWENLKIEEKILNFLKIKGDENFWNGENSQSEESVKILKESKKYENLNEEYLFIKSEYEVLFEFLNLSENDSENLKEIEKNILKLLERTKKFNILLLMNGENDDKNCFFEINSGAGGTEAQDWAEMVLRMYLRFFERNNFKYDIIDFLSGEEAGIKTATIFVKGDYATGTLESEIGIHRLVRISPFDSNKRRHTSFCAVNVIAETPDIIIDINPSDLRIDTYRAGGAGGQHVNKTDSAVRITHIPTGIVAQCQNERSQLQNKENAMKVLKARLYKNEKEKNDKEYAKIEKKKIEWGSQIRSYVLHPYKMVKDHRTDFESGQPEKILDGELMNFIEKYLIIR